MPFFIARTIFYFAVWTLYSYLLSKWSAEQDRTGDPRLISRMRAVSAPGLVVFTFTATFAFVDWIMSLEPEWFSTMYGAMFLVGQMLEAFALVIALVIVLSQWKPIQQYITPQHFHDLGNLLLAFTVLWAYLSFSQFLIIWAGNLPDEVPWYVRRLGQGWGFVAVLLVIFHFCLPFLLLLQRDVKRRATLLLKVCCLMLAVRMIDVYWVIEPSFYGNRVQIHWADFVTPVAVGGFWLALFFWQLGAAAAATAAGSAFAGRASGNGRLLETKHGYRRAQSACRSRPRADRRTASSYRSGGRRSRADGGGGRSPSVLGVFDFFSERPVQAPPNPMASESPAFPPAPRIEIAPSIEYQQLRAQEDQILSTYGWVDRKAGTTRIPIDQRDRSCSSSVVIPVRQEAPRK